MDSKTTVSDLKNVMKQFVTERKWEKYHNPKNLSMSIAIEAAELMEIFQWINPEEIPELCENEQKFTHIKEEMCDIISYCLSIANVLNIDISEEIEKKMKKNREKYPVGKFLGKYES